MHEPGKLLKNTLSKTTRWKNPGLPVTVSIIQALFFRFKGIIYLFDLRIKLLKCGCCDDVVDVLNL